MNEKIIEILKKICPNVNFEESNDFISDGLIDSFDVVLITNSIEEIFDINIPGELINRENFSSLNALSLLIDKCRKSNT